MPRSPPPPSPSLPSTRSAHLSSLVELLLAVANCPNHGPDRDARSVACECLRELETAHLHPIGRCRTPLGSHPYCRHPRRPVLHLLASVVRNIVHHGLLSSPISIISTSASLAPFNTLQCLLSSPAPVNRESSDLNLREIGRVMAFLLERPQALTQCATMELVSTLTSIAGALEHHVPAVAALLKMPSPPTSLALLAALPSSPRKPTNPR